MSFFFRILKNIFSCLLKLFKTINSIRKVLFYSNFLPRIISLKAKDNKSCYILGNGPSLNINLTNNYKFLINKELFVVNDFAKSKYFESLQPKYYVFADPSYWDLNVYDIYYNSGRLLLQIIKEKTTWPLFLLIPNSVYQKKTFQTFYKSNKNITLINYNVTEVSGFEKTNFLFYEKYLGMPQPKNVLIPCIFYAINMGYQEVNLLGTDHSWTQDLIVNDKNEVCFIDSHFYDSAKAELNPFYNINGKIYKMHQILIDYAKMFKGYHLLKKYADYKNVKIYNRTPNSFIDAFERKILD